ncbi:MAG: hypothetical protein ACK53W_12655 [Gemmatimonadota bacterium]
MQLLKYQGAALFANAVPGDTVEWQGLTWTIGEQGHMTATATEADYPAAVDLIRNGAAAEVVPEGGASIAEPLIEAARAAEVAEAEQQEA